MTAPSILICEVLNALRSWGMAVGPLSEAAQRLFDADLTIVEPGAALLTQAARQRAVIR